MVANTKRFKSTLTGKVRGRMGWFSRVIMQVQVRVDEIQPWPRRDGRIDVIGSPSYQWRDAKIDDLLMGRVFKKTGHIGAEIGGEQ